MKRVWALNLKGNILKSVTSLTKRGGGIEPTKLIGSA